MNIAYLVNIYPKTSHSFIRREILALEALGVPVTRFTIRVWEAEIVDDLDKQELKKTRIVLQGGIKSLLTAFLKTLFLSPLKLLKALRLTLKIGINSDRGLLLHFIYLLEACKLRFWLAEAKIGHLHSHFGTNSTTVAMLCQILGGPSYSFTVHGPEEFDKVQAIALPEKLKRAKFVVAISSYGRSQLYRWCDYRDWSKIHIVHCGLDPNFFQTEIQPLPEQNRLVCVGRLSEQKGQILLLQAIHQLIQAGMDLKLTLVGDGDLRLAIEAAIAELKLQEYVEITGWATEQEVKNYINHAKAMILPSFAEGLPVVLMESLAMGRPVVSTYIAGIPELIEPNVSGWLVPAGDVDALSHAIKTLLTTPLSTLTTMGLQGRKAVVEHHNILKEAQTLANLFKYYQDK